MPSALIRWQTRSRYSHAALQRRDGRIVEAWAGDGVRVKKLSDWRGVDAFEVPCMSTNRWDIALGWAQSQVGSRYDWRGVFRFVTRSEPCKDEKWFCSELVFQAFKQAGIDLLHRVQPARVSPGLLSYSPLLSYLPNYDGQERLI